MKSMKNFISLFIAFLIVGCASTRMTSFKDPDYQKAEFKRILIVANTNDLEDRQKLESKMVAEFSDIGVFALESFRLFPPTRELTDEDKVELLLKNDIDAFISMQKEMYKPESEDALEVPLSSFTIEKIIMQQQYNMLSTLKGWGFESRQMTPDFDGITNFMTHRFNYYKDDIDHENIFPK